MEETSADDAPDDETEWEGTEPRKPLPTFDQDYRWPAPLDKILSFGKTAPQRDVLLLGALTVLGALLSLILRCLYSRKWQHPCLQTFVVLLRSLEDASLVKPDPGIAADNLKDGIITRHDMAITDEDFHAVLALGETLYLHATHILSFLGHTEVKNRGMADKEMLFAEMPQEFTRRQLLEKAEEIGMPGSSALSLLQRLKKKGAVESTGNRGVYIKK